MFLGEDKMLLSHTCTDIKAKGRFNVHQDSFSVVDLHAHAFDPVASVPLAGNDNVSVDEQQLHSTWSIIFNATCAASSFPWSGKCSNQWPFSTRCVVSVCGNFAFVFLSF